MSEFQRLVLVLILLSHITFVNKVSNENGSRINLKNKLKIKLESKYQTEDI